MRVKALQLVLFRLLLHSKAVLYDVLPSEMPPKPAWISLFRGLNMIVWPRQVTPFERLWLCSRKMQQQQRLRRLYFPE